MLSLQWARWTPGLLTGIWNLDGFSERLLVTDHCPTSLTRISSPVCIASRWSLKLFIFSFGVARTPTSVYLSQPLSGCSPWSHCEVGFDVGPQPFRLNRIQCRFWPVSYCIVTRPSDSRIRKFPVSWLHDAEWCRPGIPEETWPSKKCLHSERMYNLQSTYN